MTPLYVCTQTVDRHDCLAKLVASCATSTRRPDGIFIVDHGYDNAKVGLAVEPHLDGIPYSIITLEDPGCALNGNWFHTHVPDDHVGCGDDVVFSPTALELLARTPGDFVIPRATLNPFACCLLRKSCYDKVGPIDEQLSPGYLYYEDTDYMRRMELAGVQVVTNDDAVVEHQNGGSQTYLKMQQERPEAFAEHCRRFWIAGANYAWRWGGPPFKETLTTPRPWPRPDGWPNGETTELAPRTKADVLRALGRA